MQNTLHGAKVALAFLGAWAAPAIATTATCNTTNRSDPTGLYQQLSQLTPERPKLRVTFRYDLRDLAPRDDLERWRIEAHPNVMTGEVVALMDAMTAPESRVANFDEYLRRIESRSSHLDLDSRLAFLSQLGKRLLECADRSSPPPTGDLPMQVLFENGLTCQGRGVCRHIHKFTRLVAERLGFVDVGQHAGIWTQPSDPDKTSSAEFSQAHQVAHFRDPKTGDIYVQNYESIINTRQKNIPDAVDVSTRVLSALTAVSRVETRPGSVHLLRPRTALWIAQLVGRHSQTGNPDEAIFTADVAQNGDVDLGVHLEWNPKLGDVKLFAGGVRQGTYEGYYLSAVAGGVLRTRLVGRRPTPSQSRQPRVVLDFSTQAGVVGLKTPRSPVGEEAFKPAGFAFVEGQLSGRARIAGPVSVVGDAEASMYDIGLRSSQSVSVFPWNLARVGIAIGRERSISMDITRAYQLSSVTAADRTFKTRTRDTRLRLRAGNDQTTRPFFFTSDVSAYVLGSSVRRPTATAVTARVQAGARSRGRGSASVLFDHGSVQAREVDTPQADSYFFDIPSLNRMGASLESRDFSKGRGRFKLGADYRYERGRMPLPIATPADVQTPETGQHDRGINRGAIWLKLQMR